MRIAFTLGAAVKAGLAMLAGFAVLASGTAAAADDAPRLPDEVAGYFSQQLIPRLADLYGPGADGTPGIDFAESITTIGDIRRVMVWTEAFRSGEDTYQAVELSNSWVAPVARVDGAAADAQEGAEVEAEQLGLAVVWINPGTNSPELANFVPSSDLGPALTELDEGAVLVHDAEQDAWFALADDMLTPLAQGGNVVSGRAMPLEEAQQTLWKELDTLPPPRTSNGFVIAGLTLAFVVVLLAVFVLVPDRRRAVLDPEVALGFSPQEEPPPARRE